MKELTPTPGEWVVLKHATPDYAPQFGVYAGDDTNGLAIVRGPNAAVDVRVIAAAPRMLRALRRVADVLATDSTPQSRKLRMKVAALLYDLDNP